ncbi:MAG: glucose-6-phosphate isomerase family protein [Bacillota bacterium]|nr:glucose-6-phosphate isomerase family protein [Bacillota bacterium]
MNSDKPFVLDFDLLSGLCKSERVKPKYRYASDMRDQFLDKNAADMAIKAGNPLLYEFYGLDLPERDNVLQFGTTKIYPGKIGSEYYMTKGHFHTLLDTSEIYYCLRGHGIMMMETPEGDVDYREMLPGDAIYVPGRWAHRSINTGATPFVMFFVYRADAGHDYGTIEEKGFRRLVVEKNGKPVVTQNPKWL